MPNSVEFQPPGNGRLSIVPRVVISKDHILFTPLGDVPLDLVHSPDWELGEEISRYVHR